ncbi:chemotaxis protein MotB [Novosphingobium capsulatum]|uniref:Chemotaxis protein MotB n=1 Tax=Novosphingobium capsulatum TaxID=13688 RepID=A0ABU1MRG5_9SPHN|nr:MULTISPECIES: flagellar motor protein MotB [Novosphingobium]KPF52291.1 flagellar motor protein [Novosphingobium sp. AAP1]MBB3359453.1 chemotaxis protein MotB [Novosphingobium sp. BK256]MBB3375813.1 chemotaxis protein MotB [Novosphingobium sp. BK280]MBB3380226.1 chemotaxis protein MotB [Novosphingobium sp. BK258]MBB3421920.1 chemotaxis protein MotB [Novosphingobium sp. BK267]
MAKPPKGKDAPKPIIVKKITVVAGGHHGGAWKVAYADFVTAMMAFFLLMWLLGATTEKQRKGIADYFTPTLVKTRKGSAGSDGLLGGSSLTDADNYPHRAGQTGTRTMTIPRDATGGPKDGGSKMKRTQVMQQRLKEKLDANEKLRQLAKQVHMTMTPEGIRIDMLDDAHFSMFRLGTTILTPDALELIRAIGQAIAPEPGGLTVRGHTDALQWKPGDPANNWSLSAGRAEATRQALMRNGVGEARFQRIEGVADREPLVPDSPNDPSNRRMSILLLD